MESSLMQLVDLQGKVAIVTGGAQGIGRGIAETLSAAGAQVVIADRNHDEADALVNTLRKQGRAALAIETDVADETSVQTLVQKTVEQCKHIDIVVNNAGIFPMKPLRELDAATWDRTLAVNLRGAFLYPLHRGTHDYQPHRGQNHQHLDDEHRTYLCWDASL